MKERKKKGFFFSFLMSMEGKKKEKAWKWICMVLGSGGEGKN